MSNILSCLLGLLLFFSCSNAYPQKALFDVNEWYGKLSSKTDINNSAFKRLIDMQASEDSTTIINFLSQLENRLPGANLYYQARVNCFAARVKFNFKDYKTLDEITALVKKAMEEAYETNDKVFIALIAWACGSAMIDSQQLELAVTYRLKADEIFTETGYPDAFGYIDNWAVIGELLFHTTDYEQSILYTRKALDTWEDKSVDADYLRVRYYNTIAQDFEQLDKLDSAIIYLDSSLNLAEKRNQLVWIAINSGYKGEVLFKQQEYQKAKPWLEYDYAYNKNDLTNLAAKSLQWMARINLLEGKNDSALLKAKESLRLIRNAKYKYLLQPSRTLELCYYTLAQAYEAVDNADSFYHYTHLSTRLHDSIQEVAFLSSSRIVQMKLSDEKKQRTIEKLQNEKRNEVVTRNLILVAILLLSVIGIIYVKQTKLKQRHREEIALKEKTIAETQLAAAKERMQQFTENIVEKSNLIEKLNQQLSGNDTNGETQQVLKELTNTTILTEGDWENFKKVFEKIYPRFFIYLKEKAPGITVAEQRMAALTRLQLTNRQMASMLGISVDSVHKTRQRLRKRFDLTSDANLEIYIAAI